MKYRQLSAEERVQIATLRSQNYSLPKIAQILGRLLRPEAVEGGDDLLALGGGAAAQPRTLDMESGGPVRG